MSEPPHWVLSAWIVMRPVDEPTLRVPFVDTGECDQVSRPQGSEPRRDVDVVSEEKRLAGRKTQDEALVAGALVVVRQDPRDDPLA